MPTPNLGWENQVENTLQPGVAFNLLADEADAAIAGYAIVNFETDGNLTLARTEWMTAMLIITDSDTILSSGVDVNFPEAFPTMLVVNDTAQSLVLTNGAADSVSLGAGETARITAGPDGIVPDPSFTGGVPEAPIDGNTYGRKDGSWESISAGGEAPTVVLSGSAYDMSDLTPGAWHVFTSSSPVTVTVEDESVEPVPANAEYGIEARGTGGVTLDEDNSAVIIPPKGGTLQLEEGDFAVLKRTAADEYKLVGSTVAAP